METVEATREQRERWERARANGLLESLTFGAPEYLDTVGAVALDEKGNLAAGSSTGGIFGKLSGRVGDAPVPGAGMYASKRVAVVGTGVGEVFVEVLAAARVAAIVADGQHPQKACEEVIRKIWDRAESAAGLLALDATGRVGAAFTGASWSVQGPRGRIEAVQLEMT